ncbi:4-alpha-glucanotransferase [Leptotrichia shahii]|uniref:4-alpha-glucanotransferase n=1 Tax=Leptotrichia shahii TaxID=157691 RepID=UPI0028D29E08|nr:4-alpha-glucanotransferase [Leptotrichia shahii]
MLQYFFYFVNEIMPKIKIKITFTYMLTFGIKYSIFSIEKEKFNFINNFKEEIEMFERSSGILLHPTSLPGKYGIGSLGKEAYKFVDFLKKSNQKLWQIFPLGPTGYGDSPYQCFSSFAGNPYLIDFDLLIEQNLLTEEDLKDVNFGGNEEYIDYGAIYNQKYPLLRKAYENFKANGNKELKEKLETFKTENSSWLDDYSLYISLKNHFNGLPWNEWEDDIRTRKEAAINKYKAELANEIEYHNFIQFLFFTQWNNVKKYANDNGIKIIGDIPIFVAVDSSDAWANPEIFLFDPELKPVKVAGVPPDYFSATGQLWGNPLYDWDKLKELNYKWWVDRVKANLSTCDIIRIDHFRGFDEYWAVPYGDKTAENGTWCPGPRTDLFNTIKNELGELPIIAEDLGTMTQGVIDLREATGFPGMKILGFAFDSKEENDYLPHTYTKNCVVYTGTHDNDTLIGWFTKANEDDKQFARNYLNSRSDNEIHWDAIRGAWSSVANMAIAPIQDFLGLGSEARINTPGLASGNWQWRLKDGVLTDELAERIAKLTKVYSR